MRAFRLSEVELDPSCREVRVEGELDLSVVDQFRTWLEAAAAEDVEVLVRLDQCDFIDSAGIAAIVLAHQQLAAKGRRLAVCEPSPAVSRILAVTGLSDHGLVYASIDAARAEHAHMVSPPLRAGESLQQLAPDQIR